MTREDLYKHNPGREKLFIVVVLLILLAVGGVWLVLTSGVELPRIEFANPFHRNPATAQPPQTQPPANRTIAPATPAPSPPLRNASNTTTQDRIAIAPTNPACQKALESLGRENYYKDGSFNARIAINASTVQSVRGTVLDGREVCEVVVQDRDRFGSRVTATFYIDPRSFFSTRRIVRGG